MDFVKHMLINTYSSHEDSSRLGYDAIHIKWTIVTDILGKLVASNFRTLVMETRSCTMKLKFTMNCILTLSLLMSHIYGAAANASKWQMGFNSAFNR
jgi:hypothetical protein